MAHLASGHGYLRCFLLFQLFSTILALDLMKGSFGRRHVLEKISAVVIGGAATASIGPSVASAVVQQTPVEIGITKGVSSFAAYNIIPDASARLDPKLVKLKVSTAYKIRISLLLYLTCVTHLLHFCPASKTNLSRLYQVAKRVGQFGLVNTTTRQRTTLFKPNSFSRCIKSESD